MTTVIRILIVDDSELVRTGLQSVLQNIEGLEIVGMAVDVHGAIDACARCKPDVVLLDIRLPDGSGIDACRTLLKNHESLRVLFLTSSAANDIVDDAIRSGAHGYLLKEINTPALVQAIRDVASGKSTLDPSIASRVWQLLKSAEQSTPAQAVLKSLSPQETRVLALIADGLTNKEVGLALDLSEKTVKNYLANIFDKLHVTRRSQAAVAYSQGFRTKIGPNGPTR
jgi:two-component system, NarL family, response regulator DevR